MNIGDIAGAKNAAEHQRRVSGWARQVWNAWHNVHRNIHELVKE